jgi:quercetin dioxygenase-like cupin family protein
VWNIRRVVTGHDDNGRAVFLSDGPPPASAERGGFGVSDLLWLAGPLLTAGDGGEPPPGPRVLEPPAGGLSVRLIRMPPVAAGTPDDGRWLRVPGDDDQRPGMHTTDTLDLMVVFDGHIVLGLDEGEHAVGPGDVVIQRSTAHRWRVEGDAPCTYMVAMLRPESGPASPVSDPELAPRSASTADKGPRRVVTGTSAGGRSSGVIDGAMPRVFTLGATGGATMIDAWQTGGPLARPDQGGDPEGDWELEPLGRGVAFRVVEYPPGSTSGTRGWHTTSTIDIDLILEGHMEMALPDLPPVILGPGDVVIQRATEHRWQPAPDERVRMAAFMLSLPGEPHG